MILIIHIISALSSLVLTGYVFIRPSKSGLKASYALVALMLATGTYLVVVRPEHITQTCTEGLIYLAIVSWGMILARKKLQLILPKHANQPSV